MLNVTREPGMIRPDFKTILLDQRGATVILWSFFTAFLALYVWIARAVVHDGVFLTNAAAARLTRITLWLLVIVDLGYLSWWKKSKLSRKVLMGGSGAAKILRALADHKGEVELRAASIISTYVTRKVTAFAIIEAVAVYGFVLAVAGGYLWDLYLLSGLSLLLLVIEFPTKSFHEGLLSEIESAAAPSLGRS